MKLWLVRHGGEVGDVPDMGCGTGLLHRHGEISNWPAYYKTTSTTTLPLVRQNKEDHRELALMTWDISKDGKTSFRSAH